MADADLPVLLLDLDGTLVDSLPGLLASLRAVLAPARPFEAGEVRAMIGDGVEALVRRAAAARGMAFVPAVLQAFVADYTARAGRDDVLFPGVADTLAACRGAWRLAVCTNKPEAPARAMLDTLGLGGTFAAVCGGDSLPVRKPDPGHLLGTLAAAGGGRGVMVGDHANDVLAARGAGLPCVFAGWGYGTAEMAAQAAAGGAPVAARFAEVPGLAGELLAGGLPAGG